jgi:hypothetical protein
MPKSAEPPVIEAVTPRGVEHYFQPALKTLLGV